MSVVKVGEIIIGRVTTDGEHWTAARVTTDGFIQVGQAPTQTQALNLLGQSLIYRSLNPQFPPAILSRLQDAINQLEGLGLSPVSNLIRDALKESR